MPGTQPLFAHEPGDSVLAAAMAEILEIEPDTWAAVGAAACFKALRDQRPQLGVLTLARALGLAAMGGKTALAELERLGQRGGGDIGRRAFPSA